MKAQHIFKILFVAVFSLVLATSAHADGFFSGRYKVLCPSSPEGCDCISKPGSGESVAIFYHAQMVEGANLGGRFSGKSDWVELRVGDKSCFYPHKKLRPIHWENDLCPAPNEGSDIPLRPLNAMISTGSSEGQKISLGTLFPTFYNIANEAYHSGAKTEPLTEAGSGKHLATVSRSFREDLDMEGTGKLLDGRVLNVGVRSGGSWKYQVLPEGVYGVGILSHFLHPYRSVAVDFVYLCKQAGLDFCDQPEKEIKKRLVGALLYLPKLRGIALPDGSTHDGFMCAQDVGGAIKNDRVDVFVGPFGGGNPYLAECRQHNPLMDAGILSVVPSDWRTYEASGADASGVPLFKRAKEFEYRVYAAHKALEAYLIKDAFCRP
jgi:hypothetical protein